MKSAAANTLLQRQISALLSRPMIIDRTDCDVNLPSLTLEDYTPSPLLHMKLQSGLVRQLSNRFGLPKNVVKPTDIQVYQAILERWMGTFPMIYDFTRPDKSSDLARPWIVLHRFHLHTMAYSMALYPIRAYLAKPMSKYSSSVELQIRRDGVDYSLRLLDTLHHYFDYIYPRKAKLHFIVSSIFDTAAGLCSAIIHDQDESIPRRREIPYGVDKAVGMLKRLSQVAKPARIWYDVLVKVLHRTTGTSTAMIPPPVPLRKWPMAKEHAPVKLDKSQMEAAVASNPGFVESLVSYYRGDPLNYQTPVSNSTTPGQHAVDNGSSICSQPTPLEPEDSGSAMANPPNKMHMYGAAGKDRATPCTHMTPPMYAVCRTVNLNAITGRELGDLATICNNEILNFSFVNPWDGILAEQSPLFHHNPE